MKSTRRLIFAISLSFVAGAAWKVGADGYQDTPLVPGTQWHVHDGQRTQPDIVVPGTFSSQELPGKAPSDAKILFDGTGLENWKNGAGGPAGWDVKEGFMQVKPGAGDLTSKAEFGDCQMHIEWSAPTPPAGEGQGRGNSGLFMMGRYEIQILDNFQNPTYADGTASAIYGQTPPQVNAVRAPGQWNVYDVIWEGPRFKDGKLEKPAYATVLVNGIVTQNHTQLIGDTPFRSVGKYSPHSETGPIKLQDHNNAMRFRNIWVRPLKPVEKLELAQ